MTWGGKRRLLVEEDAFTASLNQLGAERIDAALEILVAAISNRPDGFDVVPGFDSVRLAKIDRIPGLKPGDEDTPALRLWFRELDGERVALLAIEEAPAEE